MKQVSILILSILLQGCAVRWVLLEGITEPVEGIKTAQLKVGLDLSGVETVEMAEAESRVWRFPMQAQLVERALLSRYRNTKLQFEIVTGNQSSWNPEVNVLLTVSGGFRIRPFTCAADFEFELSPRTGASQRLRVSKSGRFGVAAEIKETCEAVMQQVIAELDQAFSEGA